MPQRVSILFLPLVNVSIGLFLSLYLDNISLVWQELLTWLPVALATVAMMMAWHFNKGRILLIVLLYLLPLIQTSTLGSSLYLSIFFVFVTLNSVLLSQMSERGFLNRFALNRVALLLMQLLWCYALYSEWVHINNMTRHLVSTTSFTAPFICMLLVLSVSLFFLLMKWWKEADFFSACTLASLFIMTILNTNEFNEMQRHILLSSVFFVWCVYLLIDSHKMAYIDDLTQLPGRRALNERLISLSKHYAIAMLDVDHFKKFNDTYGHDMGDIVLKKVARNVSKVINGGRGFRYGGEEFAIIFANKTKKDIEAALELVRKTIANEVISVTQPNKNKSTNVSVTISIGAAFSKNNRKAEDVIKVADDYLYKAKKSGRNRVVLEARGGR